MMSHMTSESSPTATYVADTSSSAELVNVSKTFGSTVALENVSLALHPGEVLALVGENGAGKSTCVKILAGVYRPDSGHVRMDDRDVSLHSPLDAQRLGIAVVHQSPSLFGELSIAENVFAGQPPRNRAGLIDHARMRRESGLWLSKLGLARDPATLTGTLRTSEQQLVEIARALAAHAKVLILDEPTAALTSGEVGTLFAVIDGLRKDGVSMMFVGHRLEEIFRISDRITVLRDGRWVATQNTRETTQPEAVRLMVGRPLTDLYPARRHAIGSPVLEVKDMSAPTGLRDINLTIRAGEIVGLAGLVGSGRTELARVLFGVEKRTQGSIALSGEVVHIRSASGALAHGIAYVSEDRRGQSLIEEFSILDNATLPVVNKATRLRLVFTRLQLALVSNALGQMRLKFQDYGQPVGTLSGGNQQKVVLAKWLATNPRVLILDEPTQGIDIQAKAEVHRIVSGLAEQGLGILLISSDMPEILGMSDRVVVMRRGVLVAEYDRAEASQEALALAATGAEHVTAVASLGELRAPDIDSNKGFQQLRPALGPTRPLPADGSNSVARLLPWLRVIAARREMGLLGALAAMIIPISLINSRFLSSTNLSSVASEASLVGVVALGQLLVILTRNIDLSVGSVIGLSAFVFGDFVKGHPHAPVIVAVALSCGIGVACGVINGLIVSYGHVPAIVVTLGTLYVYRGIDSILSNGKEIAPGDIPQSIQNLVGRSVLGIPMLVWICAALFVLVGFVLRWTLRGRETYQVGSNPDGARLIGVPLNRRVTAAFAVSGLLAGFDGALWAAHYGIVDGQSAYGLELTVVAAVVVGGAALRGGYGSAFGVALGTVALFTIQNVLELARVDSNDLQAFYGAAIIFAVSVDALIGRRSRRTQAVI
jgi:rhamnose transport system ATP-binding protein